MRLLGSRLRDYIEEGDNDTGAANDILDHGSSPPGAHLTRAGGPGPREEPQLLRIDIEADSLRPLDDGGLPSKKTGARHGAFPRERVRKEGDAHRK